MTEAGPGDSGGHDTRPVVEAKAGDGITLHLSPERVGLAVTALIVFLGTSVIGPRLAALRRVTPRRVAEKTKRAAEAGRRQATEAGVRARKRVRRLGGGTIRL